MNDTRAQLINLRDSHPNITVRGWAQNLVANIDGAKRITDDRPVRRIMARNAEHLRAALRNHPAQ